MADFVCDFLVADTRARAYPVQQDSYESYRDEPSPPPHGRNWNYAQEDPYYPYDQEQRSSWATAAVNDPRSKVGRGLPHDPQQSDAGPRCEPYGGYDSAGFFSGADRTDGLFQYSPQRVETTRPFGIPEFSPTHDDDDAATYIEYPDGQMVVEYPDGKVVEYPTLDSAPVVTRSDAYVVPAEVHSAVPSGANRLPQPDPEPPPMAGLGVDDSLSRRRSFYEPTEPERKPEPPGLKVVGVEPETPKRRSFYEAKQQLAPVFETPASPRTTGDDTPASRRKSFYEANEPTTVPSSYEPRSEPAKRKDSSDEPGVRGNRASTKTDGRRKASSAKMEGDVTSAPSVEEHAPPRKTGVSVSFCEEVNQVYPGPPALAEEPVPEEPVSTTDSLAVPGVLAAAVAADDRPPIIAVTAEPGMSRGKLHWLSAFNRIVNQLNEVSDC